LALAQVHTWYYLPRLCISCLGKTCAIAMARPIEMESLWSLFKPHRWFRFENECSTFLRTSRGSTPSVPRGAPGGQDWAVLILQSAGTVVHEGLCMEDDRDGVEAYLTGSGHNACIVRDYFIRHRNTPQEQIQSVDFSVDQGELHPRTVIQDFLQKHRSKGIFIYYCGHGDANGAWCFTRYGCGHELVKICPSDVSADFAASGNTSQKKPFVFSQCCYSGNWAYQSDLTVITSASPFESSRCTPHGSEITLLFFKDSIPWQYDQCRSTPWTNRPRNRQ
jgi:hypothetical protein